jgi:hypothetical protein
VSTALSVILLIAVVLAVGLLRDSLRTGAVTRWGRSRGFARVPKEQQDIERLKAWAERFRPRTASQWGIVLRGEGAGFETTIAEHQENRTAKSDPDRWHTLAITRVPGLKVAAVRVTRAGSQAFRKVLDAATAPGRAVRDSLGIDVTERPAVHPVGQGKWAVEVANEDALRFWSSETQAAAIDAWPHDAELAAVDEYVLVRVPGLINAAHLDDLLACAGAARALFSQAARTMSEAR